MTLANTLRNSFTSFLCFLIAELQYEILEIFNENPVVESYYVHLVVFHITFINDIIIKERTERRVGLVLTDQFLFLWHSSLPSGDRGAEPASPITAHPGYSG